MPIYGVLLSRLGWGPWLLLGLVRQAAKEICRTVGPSLAACLEALAYHQNVASLSLFYRYYFGRCSSELAQLVPLPFSQEKSTSYSDCMIFLSPFLDVTRMSCQQFFLAQQGCGIPCL